MTYNRCELRHLVHEDATIDGLTKNLVDTLQASNDNGTLEEYH